MKHEFIYTDEIEIDAMMIVKLLHDKKKAKKDIDLWIDEHGLRFNWAFNPSTEIAFFKEGNFIYIPSINFRFDFDTVTQRTVEWDTRLILYSKDGQGHLFLG